MNDDELDAVYVMDRMSRLLMNADIRMLMI
jgi:hypothetical protein